MQKKTEQLSLPQRALCNWMLFLHTLLLKHGVHPCDFHTDFFSHLELLCSMLYLQCVITSMTPPLLEASECCPSAPGTLVLSVLHTAWNEGQPMGSQLLCSHLTHLRHENPISSLPIPTNQAANQFLLTRLIWEQWQLAIPTQHNPLLRLPQTRHFHSLSPDWIHHCTTVTLLIIFII